MADTPDQPAASGAPKLPFDLQKNESVVLFTRRHPVFLIAQLVKVVLAGIVPVIAVTWLVQVTAGLGSGFGRIVLFAELAWLVLWTVRGYFDWYGYQNDIWVVTDQRIIDSTKSNWFNHRMASADLVDVEDIAVRREGVLPTAFNFGDLQVQTAGERPNFVLAGIPKPAAVLGTIDARRDAARRELSGRQL
ncbi:MAG: PH domain-containing protein [Chloroflexi bacterium]|nr:PH domain-containing protein [Chloroflexota bacterium]